MGNEAWCDVCLGTDGDQLCCDGCTKSFHLMCLNPPAQEAPLGEWFCAQCACKRRRLDAGAEIDVEIEKEAPFPRTLIKHMQATNPENFCLPFRFFFDGSSTPLIIVEEEKGEHSLPPPLAEPSPNSRVGIVYGCRECSDGKIQNPTNICACNFCYEPYSTYEAEKLLQIRVQEEQLQVLVKWKDLPWSELSWTDAVNVPDRLLAQFMLSEPFKSMVHHVRPRLSCVETETQVLPQHGRKCHYKFINGVSFGVWQLLDLFSREELCHFEREICEMERLRHQGFFKDNTIDCTKGGRRTKYFLGFRYDYGSSTRKPKLHDDVDSIDCSRHSSWIRQVELRLVEHGVLKASFVDIAVLNIYHERGAGLGVHIDSKVLFHRPIVSLRLFSDSVLSFGCRGPGMLDRQVAVPQPRGSITVLGPGFASDKINHCIRPADINTKVPSN